MGHLELLWQAQYELGDAVIGSAAVLEHHACWRGKRGRLAEILVSIGFVDVDGNGVHSVHDFWTHVPDYVRRKHRREKSRQEAGATYLTGDRSLTGQCPASDRSMTGQCPVNDQPVTAYTLSVPVPVPLEDKDVCSEPKNRLQAGQAENDESPPTTQPAEATPEAGKIHLQLPCIGKQKTWSLDDAELATLEALYPELDVIEMARKAQRWLEANPTRKKTHRGTRRFLHTWIAKDVDAGRAIRLDAPAPGGNGNGTTKPERFVGKPNYDGSEVWDGREYVPRDEFRRRFPEIEIPPSPFEVEEKANR